MCQVSKFPGREGQHAEYFPQASPCSGAIPSASDEIFYCRDAQLERRGFRDPTSPCWYLQAFALYPSNWISARNKNVSTFIGMWSYGGDLNIQERAGGYPMDLALTTGDLDMVKACIVLDAPCTNEILQRVMKGESKNPCKEFLVGHYKKYKETIGTAINYDFSEPLPFQSKTFRSFRHPYAPPLPRVPGHYRNRHGCSVHWRWRYEGDPRSASAQGDRESQGRIFRQLVQPHQRNLHRIHHLIGPCQVQ